MSIDGKSLREKLSMPFAPEDLEWRLQVTSKDKSRGLAVPYVTNRAIQERLDEAVGPEGWYNEYRPWHGNGKKEAQICGITILFDGRPITKWDGAEDSDIEPVKGGLSDSMKRAAVQWGIGRVLYKMDTIWVDVENQGNSCAIKKTERARLDKAYLDTLDRLGLTHAKATGIQSQLTPRQERQPDNVTTMPRNQEIPWEYQVLFAKTNQGSTTLTLRDREGKEIRAFARGNSPDLIPGAALCHVKLTVRKQDSVVFYLLEGYEVIGQRPRAA